jgi:hypothetical protein
MGSSIAFTWIGRTEMTQTDFAFRLVFLLFHPFRLPLLSLECDYFYVHIHKSAKELDPGTHSKPPLITDVSEMI